MQPVKTISQGESSETQQLQLDIASDLLSHTSMSKAAKAFPGQDIQALPFG